MHWKRAQSTKCPPFIHLSIHKMPKGSVEPMTFHFLPANSGNSPDFGHLSHCLGGGLSRWEGDSLA